MRSPSAEIVPSPTTPGGCPPGISHPFCESMIHATRDGRQEQYVKQLVIAYSGERRGTPGGCNKMHSDSRQSPGRQQITVFLQNVTYRHKRSNEMSPCHTRGSACRRPTRAQREVRCGRWKRSWLDQAPRAGRCRAPALAASSSRRLCPLRTPAASRAAPGVC